MQHADGVTVFVRTAGLPLQLRSKVINSSTTERVLRGPVSTKSGFTFMRS